MKTLALIITCLIVSSMAYGQGFVILDNNPQPLLFIDAPTPKEETQVKTDTLCISYNSDTASGYINTTIYTTIRAVFVEGKFNGVPFSYVIDSTGTITATKK